MNINCKCCMQSSLVVFVLALRAAAFNLDVNHPRVWHEPHDNFGYKVDLNRDSTGEYSLLVAAPTAVPVDRDDLCSAGTCYQCPVGKPGTCSQEHITILENNLGKVEIPLETSWSPKTFVSFEPEPQSFQVTFHGSPPVETQIHRGEDELSGRLHDRAWCTADLDGDGLEDMVLGSPLSSKRDSEEGLVFVYINHEQHRPTTPIREIRGKNLDGALFGSSVACIGDINHDELQDIAVGAPGEDEGRGAIYIYHGSRDGISVNYSQHISAVDIQKDIRGFGTYISKGMDVDNNGFIDVAVGASDSGHVVLLRAQPVVRLQASLISNIVEITSSSPELTLSYGINFTAARGHLIQLESIDVKVWIRHNPLVCRVEADDSCIHSGAWLYNKTLTLLPQRTRHDTIRLQLKRGVMISPKPVVVRLRYKLLERYVKGFCKECPVVDPRGEVKKTIQINHKLSCVDHNCYTDLKLNAELINTTVQASTGKLMSVEILASVQSLSEPAFLATIIVEAAVHFPVRCTSLCSDMSTASKMRLECDVGNPLTYENGIRGMILSLDLKDVPTSIEQLQLNISVTSAGYESNMSDNFKTINVSLKTEESSVPSWVLAMSIVVGLVTCVLLVAIATAIFKRRIRRKRGKQDNSDTIEYCEPEYAVPDVPDSKEEAYSRSNELYIPSD